MSGRLVFNKFPVNCLFSSLSCLSGRRKRNGVAVRIVENNVVYHHVRLVGESPAHDKEVCVLHCFVPAQTAVGKQKLVLDMDSARRLEVILYALKDQEVVPFPLAV